MGKNKSNTRAAEKAGTNGTKAERHAKQVNKIGEAEVAALASAMFAALTTEGQAFTAAEAAKGEAGAACWNTLRDTFRKTLTTYGPAGARAVLDAFKARATLEGDAFKGRAANYSANLNRAAKATEADKPVPEALWAASRSEWNDSPFWAAAGILTNRGRKATTGKGSTGKKGTNEGDGENVGDAIVKAGKDKELSDLMALVAVLRGPFRTEFFTGATELARGIIARQTAASGGSR